MRPAAVQILYTPECHAALRNTNPKYPAHLFRNLKGLNPTLLREHQRWGSAAGQCGSCDLRTTLPRLNNMLKAHPGGGNSAQLIAGHHDLYKDCDTGQALPCVSTF